MSTVIRGNDDFDTSDNASQAELDAKGITDSKQICTAWVNFDGTTTPPTIRDSFNVRDVVRTATGRYEVYFEEDMDNMNFSVTLTSNATGYGYIVPAEYYTRSSTSKTSASLYNGGAFVDGYIGLQVMGGK